jgi:hypothetical protein
VNSAPHHAPSSRPTFDRDAVLFGAATHDTGKAIHVAELAARADVDVEDLLVSVADKVWKTQRISDLEQLVVDRLAAGADHRLRLQNSYPVAKAPGMGEPDDVEVARRRFPGDGITSCRRAGAHR